jgi:hypothetical protein
MDGPTVWTAILADPVTPLDRATLRMVVRDQRRWSRRYLYPVARVVSRLAVLAIVAVKRFLPRVSAHATMDRLCIWFLRNFVSAEAGELLIRHFVIETNLLNFVVRNGGVVGVPEVTLLPANLRELGDRAVIEHDLNVYRVLIGTGVGGFRRGGRVDTSMLRIPAIDAETGRRRLLNLDIQTALCLMNIPFALCLTPEEYQRAVHSLRLDETLLALLAEITGDETFLRWRPGTSVVRVDSTLDVPRAVYEHAVICEQAHAYLLGPEVHLAPEVDVKERQQGIEQEQAHPEPVAGGRGRLDGGAVALGPRPAQPLGQDLRATRRGQRGDLGLAAVVARDADELLDGLDRRDLVPAVAARAVDAVDDDATVVPRHRGAQEQPPARR